MLIGSLPVLAFGMQALDVNVIMHSFFWTVPLDNAICWIQKFNSTAESRSSQQDNQLSVGGALCVCQFENIGLYSKLTTVVNDCSQ